MKTKENWIESTLNSLDTIQPVSISFDLKEKIKKSIHENAESIMSSDQIWLVAASVVLLLSINLITMNYYSKDLNKTISTEEKNIVYQEYFTNINE
jgi:hypothetical protein